MEPLINLEEINLEEEDINMSYQKRLLGQQLGAYVYKDPRIVIANHDLAEVSGTFWTTDRASTEGQTKTGISLTFPANEASQTIFWGDGTNEEFSSNASLSHTWPASLALGAGEALFTSGTLTRTTNIYMNGNYVRGSSNFYAKLI